MQTSHADMAHMVLWAAAIGGIALVGTLLVSGAVNAGGRRDNETDLIASSRQQHSLVASVAGVSLLVAVMAHTMGPLFASMQAGTLTTPAFLSALGGAVLVAGCAVSTLVQYFQSAPQRTLERDSARDDRHGSARAAGVASAVFGLGSLIAIATSLFLLHRQSQSTAKQISTANGYQRSGLLQMRT
jgi:hypothetical protein